MKRKFPAGTERVFLMSTPMRVVRQSIRSAMPPMGVSYIAALIRDEFDVFILDPAIEAYDQIQEEEEEGFISYGLNIDQIKKRISWYRPDVVGITCQFSCNWPWVVRICRAVKEIDPDIVTVAGGTHPAFLAEDLIINPDLDFIALGEGETAMQNLLRTLRDGGDPAQVDGFAHNIGGEARLNLPVPVVEDLDTLPYPARDLLRNDLYRKVDVSHSIVSDNRYNVPVITSRGCPSKCIFCSSTRFWGNRFRVRSPENVLGEIAELKYRYGVDEIQFEDDNFTAKRKRAMTIMQGMIDRDLVMPWTMPNGVAMWTMNEEIIALMAESGCYEVALAIESGSQRVLRDIIKKPLNVDHAVKMARIFHKYRIRCVAYFIVGFPGETREEILSTFELARKIGVQFSYFFVATPLPGTELYRQVDEKGYLNPGFKFENLGFFYSTFQTPDWTSEELDKMVQTEGLKYNLGYVFQHPARFARRYVSLLGRPGWAVKTILPNVVRKARVALDI